MTKPVSSDGALRSALWSTRVKGLRITPKIEFDCGRIVRGEISIEEYIRQITQAQSDNKRVD